MGHRIKIIIKKGNTMNEFKQEDIFLAWVEAKNLLSMKLTFKS